MKKKLTAALMLACLALALSTCALAQDIATNDTADLAVTTPLAPTPSPTPFIPTPSPSPVPTPVPEGPQTVTEYRWFTNSYGYTRTREVTYYDNVYAINHGKYGLTPFADVVPAEYFAEDSQGYLAPASIVMDIVDAMRIRLYGADVGELGLLYGQYCEQVKDKAGRMGFSGIHEGIDFINAPGARLYSIIDGEVTRAGDSNGTIAIYNAFYDVTVLYLHCENIQVRRGDTLMAGVYIGDEGDVGSGSSYAHVEMRWGRHTSSSAYRDTKLESDCPYALMQVALSVEPSGDAPTTYAAYVEAETARKVAEAEAEAERIRREAEAERMRLEAEAAAKAAREAEEAAAAATPTPEEPEVELVDVLPGSTDNGYGFGAPSATPTAVVEATLPPS